MTALRPVVVCVRDPDASNQFTTFGDVLVHDVDLGYHDLDDGDEFVEWADDQLVAALSLPAGACELVENVVLGEYERRHSSTHLFDSEPGDVVALRVAVAKAMEA